MERIFHPYWLWEDYVNGFYDNCQGEKKQGYIKEILEMFSSEKKTLESMRFIIENWKYSCEQNLSNASMNKIAYLGQTACCYYCGAPSTVTMEAWSLIPKEHRDRADENAKTVLNEWLNKNKYIQLCLNID